MGDPHILLQSARIAISPSSCLFAGYLYISVEAHRTACSTLMSRLPLDIKAHAIGSFRLYVDFA